MTGIFSVGQYGYSYGWNSSFYTRAAGAGPLQASERTAAGPVEPVQAPAAAGPRASEELTAGTELPPVREGADPVEMAVRGRIRYLDREETASEGVPAEAEKAESPQEVMEEAECQTCKERKYQDESDDPGVSFKTATNVAPERAAAAVRGHEQEHVVREQAKAEREGRKVVSQSVTIHTGICPECGKTYVSGGTTRTTTMADNREDPVQQLEQEERGKSGFEAVA